ncbi:unnamed protein product [Prunus armeniaca]
MLPSFRPGRPTEGTFGPSSFGCGACHHQAQKLGLNGMRIDGCVALLTSDQMIDRPSKEPLLGLDSFTFLGSRMVRFRMDVFVVFMV